MNMFIRMHEFVFEGSATECKLTLNRMEDVTIDGTIGRNSQIVHAGMGTLIINAKVEDSVAFILTGMGNLKFEITPSQSIVDRIINIGNGHLIFPENSEKKSAPPAAKHSGPSIRVGGRFIGGASGENAKSIIGAGGVVSNGGRDRKTASGSIITISGKETISGDSIHAYGMDIKADREREIISVRLNGTETIYRGHTPTLVDSVLHINGSRATAADIVTPPTAPRL
jgi:hypothetical protein